MEDGDEDIEEQIAKEMSGMKRPRKETRFGTSSLVLQRATAQPFPFNV
jgi:hypothetical protein